METYIANFKLQLRTNIRSAEPSFPDLHLNLKGGPLKKIAVTAAPDANGLISTLAVCCIYAGEGLQIIGYAGSDAVDVFASGEGGGLLNPPWEAARVALTPILYWLGALTLQASVYYRVQDYLRSSVQDFTWTLPDGRILTSGHQLFPAYPGHALRDMTEAGTRTLTLQDWSTVQDICNGGQPPVALWQLVFADALRERANDTRVTIIHCATALDVAAQAVLPSDVKFNMDILDGGGRGSKVTVAPNLKNTDPQLYDNLTQLWYTRHGIAHKGETKLYLENPIKSGARSRTLTGQDVERFLINLPKGVQFIQMASIVRKPRPPTARKARSPGKK